jgi:hypothetical protein
MIRLRCAAMERLVSVQRGSFDLVAVGSGGVEGH